MAVNEAFLDALTSTLPRGWRSMSNDDVYGQQAQAEATDQPKVNVLLTGMAGVGKSTMINGVIGHEVAPVGVGRPVTMTVDEYTEPGVPIRFFDSRGIELGENVDGTSARISKIIREQYLRDDDEFVDVALYCVNEGSWRLLDFEEKIITDLAATMPVFLVLTQCYSDATDTQSVAFIKDIGARNLPIVGGRPMRVLAQGRRFGPAWVPPSGLGELVEAIYQELPNAKKRSFARGQAVRIELKITEARKVVAWATGVAALIGAVPLPILDSGPLSTLQIAMLARIQVAMGLNIDKESMARAVLPVLATMNAGRSLSKALLTFIPVAGTAINGTIAATMTGALGEAYIQACALALRQVNDPNRRLSAAEAQSLVVAELRARLTRFLKS
ncbi:GTPase [Paractinoplanes rishiriensis]|uniref:GTPase n=1 Tax=Paractinoplanes rishiriensis TaxID=1050105 RepID=A0A919K7C5_9ACTN|nr:GTPase [Actinoplanes rishiriensis]GIE99858.1 GTPase [Actinoplanes rishiriensis]